MKQELRGFEGILPIALQAWLSLPSFHQPTCRAAVYASRGLKHNNHSINLTTALIAPSPGSSDEPMNL